jgi:hypothetical protein
MKTSHTSNFSSDQSFVSITIKTNNFTFCFPNVIYSTKDAFSSAEGRNGLLFGGVPAEYAEIAEIFFCNWLAGRV